MCLFYTIFRNPKSTLFLVYTYFHGIQQKADDYASSELGFLSVQSWDQKGVENGLSLEKSRLKPKLIKTSQLGRAEQNLAHHVPELPKPQPFRLLVFNGCNNSFKVTSLPFGLSPS